MTTNFRVRPIFQVFLGLPLVIDYHSWDKTIRKIPIKVSHMYAYALDLENLWQLSPVGNHNIYVRLVLDIIAVLE